MIVVLGLYSGSARQPPFRKSFFFAGGGGQFLGALPIFWRFPTARPPP
jgi:hypothetical protein